MMGMVNSPRTKIQITRREQTAEKIVMATLAPSINRTNSQNGERNIMCRSQYKMF